MILLKTNWNGGPLYSKSQKYEVVTGHDEGMTGVRLQVQVLRKESSGLTLGDHPVLDPMTPTGKKIPYFS